MSARSVAFGRVSGRVSVRLPIRIGFVAASCSLAAVFAASASPIPLYETYRRTDGLTNGDLALTAVAYFVTVMAALLVFGRLASGALASNMPHLTVDLFSDMDGEREGASRRTRPAGGQPCRSPGTALGRPWPSSATAPSACAG